MDNFWAAYDCFTFSDIEILFKGIELAKKIQIAIMQEASSLMQMKKLRTTQSYWYVTISKEARYFVQPQGLTWLGLFLIEAYRRPGAETRPVIIGIKKESKYLVAGILGTDHLFSSTKNVNEFGVIFQEAAQAVGAKMDYSGFETSIVEVNDKQYDRFLDTLTKV